MMINVKGSGIAFRMVGPVGYRKVETNGWSIIVARGSHRASIGIFFKPEEAEDRELGFANGFAVGASDF